MSANVLLAITPACLIFGPSFAMWSCGFGSRGMIGACMLGFGLAGFYLSVQLALARIEAVLRKAG